jgi:NAD(P)-dependent dehydrogenase (short-subunit alcohol dehydrogenase family)
MYCDAQGKFDEKAFEFTVCNSTSKAKCVGKCKFDLASYTSLAATTELKAVELVLKDGALAGAILHASIGARVRRAEEDGGSVASEFSVASTFGAGGAAAVFAAPSVPAASVSHQDGPPAAASKACEALHEAAVEKKRRTGLSRGWDQRWARVRPGELLYYHSQIDAQLPMPTTVSSLKLVGAVVREEGEEGGRFRFSVTQGEESIMFACGSDDARMQFVVAIEAAAESSDQHPAPTVTTPPIDSGVNRRLSAVQERVDDDSDMRMSDEDFESVINANLTGAFRVARRATKGLLKLKRGRLIFIGSVVGGVGAAGQVNYSASKSGLLGMARSFARELGSRGITANVIAPGFVETDMTAALDEKRRTEIAASVPLGRFCSAEEIAKVVSFVASPASGYITGALIPVDGGLGMGH